MSVTIRKPLSPFKEGRLEPVGSSFSAHVRRVLHQRTFSEDDKFMKEQAEQRSRSLDPALDPDHVEDEAEDPGLLRRDPKDWKTQDHYAVLGLSRLRYRASPEQIRRAHRKKVLIHHPDKKAAASGDANNDRFFKCIAKAFEILSNPEKRRQFDSVDEAIDDDQVPTAKETKAPGADFIALWSPVFQRESRFSRIQPVPELGHKDSTKAEVEAFYNFYYNFDSWRSFEYLDENDPNEGSDSRDDKRYAEKKNKAQRALKKKEDSARLRKVVDTALLLDPRIKAFKEQEKAAREAKKKGAAQAKAPTKVPEPAKAEAAKTAAPTPAAAPAATAAASAESKKEREAAKKAAKEHKRKIRSLVKDNNYLLPASETPSPERIDRCLNEVDLLLELTPNEDLGPLRTLLESAFASDSTDGLLSSFSTAVVKTGRPHDFKVLA